MCSNVTIYLFLDYNTHLISKLVCKVSVFSFETTGWPPCWNFGDDNYFCIKICDILLQGVKSPKFRDR